MLKWKFSLLFLLLHFYGNAQGYLEKEDLIFFDSIRQDTKAINSIRGYEEVEVPDSSFILPDRFKVFDQGDYPICVPYAFAYAYAIRTYHDSYLFKDFQPFSASFMATKERACEKGLSFKTAILFGQKHGFCPITFCPNNPCDQLISQASSQIAKDNLIENWTLINSSLGKDSVYQSIKTYLSSNYPIIISTKLQRGFRSLENVEKWIPNGDCYKDKYHAMVIVGHNDKKGIFYLLNSYGKRWGKDGLIKIDYSDFWSVLHNAISIQPKNN